MRHVVLAIGLLLLGTFEIQECDAYRVLFIGPVGTRSHKNYFSSIIDALVESDHHVTFITPFPSSTTRPNVEEIAVPEGDFAKFDLNLFDEKYGVKLATSAMYFSLCDDTVKSPRVQALVVEDQKFDVAMVSSVCSDCYLWLVYRMKIPLVWVSPLDLLAATASAVGNPIFSSFQLHPFLGYEHPMTFWQRLHSALTDVGGLVYIRQVFRSIEQRCRETGLCPEDMPSIVDMYRNASMAFVNNIRELQSPVRPYVPAVVSIGGIHCRPSKQLPQDLQDWVEGSGDEGFIYFSLGSIVKPSSLPERNRQVLVRVFASLKQRVLWKWDQESMPDLPPNVLLKKWVPQQDILGHPKLRLFISQSGLYSTQESMYHGKPVLSLPVYADQLANARSVERQGWGKVIIWEEMTEDDLFDKITSIINSEEMLERVRSKSLLMRDQPMSPKSLLVYWTEYVIRHKGAAHLRCPLADMPWYTAYNVDVWLTLFGASALVFWLILRLLIAILSCLLGRAKRKID